MDFAGAQFEIGAVERARGAERLVDAAKVKKRRRVRCREGHARPLCRRAGVLLRFHWRTRSEGRQQGIEVGACDGGDGNGDQFSGVSPSRWRSRASAACWPIRWGCCMPDTSSSPERRSSMNSGMPSKAAVSTCPWRRPLLCAQRLSSAGRSERRARVDRDWPPACPGCSGRFLRPCRPASVAGWPACPARRRRKAVQEAPGARLAVLAGLRDG